MSALTVAALAIPNCIGYFPMEEAAGAVAVADAGPHALSALTLQGAGASAHILPGQAAKVPGSAGSWVNDATTGVYLQRNVIAADPMQIAGPWSLVGWVFPTAVGSANVTFGRKNNWEVFFQTGNFGAAWANTKNYQQGAFSQQAGLTYVALQNSGPAYAAGAITPGTNSAYWEQITFANTLGHFTSLGNITQVFQNGIPLNKATMLALTWDGFKVASWINGVLDSWRYTQTAAGAWDGLTQSTDAFQIFGSNSTSFPGNIWGVGVYSQALDRAQLRTLYLAGIGSGNEVLSAPFVDRVQDAATPALTANAVTYNCSTCSGQIRANEGYITVGGVRYHHGCYSTPAVAVTPAAVSAAMTMAQLSDRVARTGYDALLAATRRGAIEKMVYHDGTYLQPHQSPANAPPASASVTSQTDWRTWGQFVGEFAAVLARYGRASRESWLVKLASSQMEFFIASMIGAPAGWLGPGFPQSIAGTPVPGSIFYGMVQPAFDTTDGGNNQSWVLKSMATIYLCLKRQVDAKTLARWEQAIVAAAWYLVSGQNPAVASPPAAPTLQNPGVAAPNGSSQWYYVNGNYMLRYAIGFYLVWLVTGDAQWFARYQWSLNYCLYPYGTPLTPQGNWAALNTYSTAGDGINGPHYVRYAGSAYKCILNIAGSAGNPTPDVDAAHWAKIDTGNPANRQGYGLIIETAGADAANWSDYVAHLNEYGSGAGGGPPGSPLAGQPGYDGDYNTTDTDLACAGYLITGNPVFRQIANATSNKTGLFPAGGVNPQPSWFTFPGVFVTPGTYHNTGGANTPWVVDKTSGANGGYSTRHSLLDGYRPSWLPIAQLLGWRGDIAAGLGVASFYSQTEGLVQIGYQASAYNQAAIATFGDGLSQLLMAAPSWPGLS